MIKLEFPSAEGSQGKRLLPALALAQLLALLIAATGVFSESLSHEVPHLTSWTNPSSPYTVRC